MHLLCVAFSCVVSYIYEAMLQHTATRPVLQLPCLFESHTMMMKMMMIPPFALMAIILSEACLTAHGRGVILRNQLP